MYNISICLGDLSNDGHGLYEIYHLVSNYSAKDINDAYIRFVNKNGIDITQYCHDYLDNELYGEIVDFLLKINAIKKSDLEDKSFYVDGPDEYIELFFKLVQTELTNLIWYHRDLKEEEIMSLHYAGYGLF